MSRIRLIFGEDSISLDGAIYDVVFEKLRPLVQRTVGEALVRVLQKLASETLGAVKLYAVASADRTVREGDSSATRAVKHVMGAASGILARMKSGRSRLSGPSARLTSTGGTTGQRRMGVFEGCLKTLIVSAGFEPATLPDNLGTLSFSVIQLNEIEGNVTGLSNVSINGASWTSVGKCGIRARFGLVFKDLRVNARGSVGFLYMSRRVAVEVEIPEVEVLLEILETEDSFQVDTYNATFPSNVRVTATVEGAIGSFANYLGLSNTTLGDDDLRLFKSYSLPYVQQIADVVRGFIADPPPIPMAQNRGRPSAPFY